MNTNSKAYLLLGTSFLAGGVSGFFIAKKLLQEHYRELAQSEIDEVREFYFEKYEAKERHVKLADQYNKPDDPRDLINIRVIDEDESEDDEDDFYDEEESEDDDDEIDFYDEEESEEKEMVEEVEEDLSPRLIDYDTYILGKFDHVELYYYRLDDIVCTGEDIVVAYPHDLLGWDWEEAIKKNNTIFVRDELAKVDYEVHAVAQSYTDAVGTRLETDKEKKLRRLAREKEALDNFQLENLQVEQDENYEEVKPRKPKTEPYKRPQNPRYDQMFELPDEE